MDASFTASFAMPPDFWMIAAVMLAGAVLFVVYNLRRFYSEMAERDE